MATAKKKPAAVAKKAPAKKAAPKKSVAPQAAVEHNLTPIPPVATPPAPWAQLAPKKKSWLKRLLGH